MSKPPVFALVDCNNFFVSCERLFRPTLADKPVAVLSNNDGCIIARSNQVKALGAPMGAPLFKYRTLFSQHNVQLFSANFTLYGDISERVITILKQLTPHVEVYSIDESFLQIDMLQISNYTKWAQEVAQMIEKHVGIPVSVGVAPTKTLAKLATERAKRNGELMGGFSLATDTTQYGEQLKNLHSRVLSECDLPDIWGVGRRHTERLQRRGLRTAWDVANLSDEWVLRHMTITGLRTVRELRGECCIPLGDYAVQYQQKMASSTRSFGKRVRDIAELQAAIASLAARAAMRLRRKDQLAWQGSAFLRAQLPDKSYRFISASFRLTVPTAFTGDIIKAAHWALEQIYDPDLRYEKGGVILTGLVDKSAQQLALVNEQVAVLDVERQDKLMAAVDNLSLRYGKGVVAFAAERASAGRWRSKQERVSPAYTTRWDDLPMVKVR